MRRNIRLLLTAMLIFMLSGCAGFGGDDPNELLSQAVSDVIGKDDFTFEGTTRMNLSGAPSQQEFAFTGVVNDHNEILIEPNTAETNAGRSNMNASNGSMLHYSKVNRKWTIKSGTDKQLSPLYTLNPLIQLEHLNRASKQVEVDTAKSGDSSTVLRAAVKEAELLKLFKQQIRQEHEEVINDAEEAARTAGNEQLDAELAQFSREAERQLEEILRSLKVQADYEIAVDRRSRRLNELHYTAQLQYELDGSGREETIETIYRFLD